MDTSIGKYPFLGTPAAVPDGIRSALQQLVGEWTTVAIEDVLVLEHSTFARLHGRARATTRRRRIFLRGSGSEFFSDPELLLHEYCHVVLQWESGALTVPRYVRECLRRGYWNNRYELEARSFAYRHLSQFRALLAAGAGPRPSDAAGTSRGSATGD